jgi:hypothetical protein
VPHNAVPISPLRRGRCALRPPTYSLPQLTPSSPVPAWRRCLIACLQHVVERRELRSLIATITEAEEQKAAEAEHAHVTAREELRNRATDRIQELSRTLDDRIMELVRGRSLHSRPCLAVIRIKCASLGACVGVSVLPLQSSASYRRLRPRR